MVKEQVKEVEGEIISVAERWGPNPDGLWTIADWTTIERENRR